MRKSKNLKKAIVSFAMVSTLVIGTSATCFADTGSTPAHLTVPTTSIDFTVTEKVTMTGTSGSTDLTVDNLVITNNATIGKISIDEIKTQAAGGYTIVAESTDFTKMEKDAKKVSIVADGTHDLSSPWTSVGELEPAGATNSKTIKLTGKTGLKTVSVSDEKVADIITTISII